MKKVLVLLCMLAMLIVGSDVFAGSIDYLSNQSARYLMTFNRNAATDGADIANYNPAGTAFLAKGLHLDFSTQTLFKPYSQDSNVDLPSTLNNAPASYLDISRTQEQDEPTPILPNFYAVYNFGQMGGGNLAAFFQAGIVAGGGKLKWDEGTAGTLVALTGLSASITNLSAGVSPNFGNVKSSSLEVSSVYYGLALGASYSLFDNMVAVSLGGRVVMPKRSIKISGTFKNLDGAIDGEYEYDAVGYTPIIGVCVKPISGLTIGLRYEFETDLEFEYSQKSLSASATGSWAMGTNQSALASGVAGLLQKSGIEDGKKFNQNLPAILAAGAEYVVMPGLTVMVQGMYYFMKSADLGQVRNSATGDVVGDMNDYYNNGWEFSIGASYQVMPELKIGIGYNYTCQNAKSELFNNANTLLTVSGNAPLDSMTYGLGATYTIADMGLDITVAASWTHYMSETYEFTSSIGPVSGKYEKDVYNIGLGIGYRL